MFLYSFNYHQPVERVGAHLVQELDRLRAEHRRLASATVVVFSYSAIVFREAVISADDQSLFSDMSLIQLGPTAGGSLLARWIETPVFGPLAAWASKPSAAENPYGRLAVKLWDGEGNRKFYEVIRPERMHTILLEADPHSLAAVQNQEVQRRYKNGVGTNVVVIPKSAGVTHDYFPTHPVGLEYLRRALQRTAEYADTFQNRTAPTGGFLPLRKILPASLHVEMLSTTSIVFSRASGKLWKAPSLKAPLPMTCPWGCP